MKKNLLIIFFIKSNLLINIIYLLCSSWRS